MVGNDEFNSAYIAKTMFHITLELKKYIFLDQPHPNDYCIFIDFISFYLFGLFSKLYITFQLLYLPLTKKYYLPSSDAFWQLLPPATENGIAPLFS